MPFRKVEGFHFLPSDRRLRFGDNRLVEAGKTYSVAYSQKVGDTILTKPKVGVSGLHCATHISSALTLAPGFSLCKVKVSGSVSSAFNLYAGKHRKVFWIKDAEEATKKACLVLVTKINMKFYPQLAGEAEYAYVECMKLLNGQEIDSLGYFKMFAGIAGTPANISDVFFSSLWPRNLRSIPFSKGKEFVTAYFDFLVLHFLENGTQKASYTNLPKPPLKNKEEEKIFYWLSS